MPNRMIKLTACFIVFCLIVFMTGVSVFSYSDKAYSISGYDVNVRINTDGSLDVTESVKYASYGGYNNVMLLIDKQEGEEVEIQSVYMLKKDGYIECDRLSAGQWDANVFSGTYSVIQERGNVRVKVYGTFSNRYGSIVVKYSVKNAIKRYGDVAEYKRNHIMKSWDGRISNINITVLLPGQTEPPAIRTFLHGVLVGRKKVESSRSITFNVPDTVPGEYVEARIVFPENVVYNSSIIDETPHLETILQEEQEYNESDKAELLEARENAAREAGRRAWADRMKQRAEVIATVFSILASLLGIYTLLKIQGKLRQLKKTPLPLSLKEIEQLSPPEVRLLLANGKTGARAVLGSLFQLTSEGYLKLEVLEENNQPRIIGFYIVSDIDQDGLSYAERHLIRCIAQICNETGIFDPRSLLTKALNKESAKMIKDYYDEWEQCVLKSYSDRNILGSGLLFYRNLGLIFGAVLFFLGCVIPVSLSIWAGYAMLPVGLALYLYTLRIGKHTDYGVAQHRIWKSLKKRILNRNIALDSLPVWMTDAMALLGYSVALGTEKQLQLVDIALLRSKRNMTENPLSQLLDHQNNNRLAVLIKETIRVLDEGLSSVQDVG